MTLTCLVTNCASRASRDQVSFFSVPTATKFMHATLLNELSAERRQRWLDAINRDDLTESKIKNQKVCSKHFVTGKPASLKDVTHRDWVPTLNMGYAIEQVLKRNCGVDQKEGLGLQKRHKEDQEVCEVDQEVCEVDQEVSEVDKEICEVDQEVSEVDKEICEVDQEVCEEPVVNTTIEMVTQIDQEVCEEPVASTSMQAESGTSTQTDLTGYDIDKQIEQLAFVSGKMEELSNSLNKSMLTFDNLKSDNEKCYYYSGFNFGVLEVIFNRVKEFIPTSSKLEPFQQFLIAFMKLRLNLSFTDIAFRFDISQSSSYFNVIIDILYKRFQTLIIWPERESINKNLPTCFKEVFCGKTTVIVDCFEILIEKPAKYLIQQQSSNYKDHYTVKYLIGITPQGTISYISDAWGGRTSNKQIVENCGFLNKINPNDIILTNRGFLLSKSPPILGTNLVIPAFTKIKKQLIPLELEETSKHAHVVTHIERIIGAFKSKFMIFKGPLPINMLTNTIDNVNICDKIIVVCCALINLSPPVVPL